MVDGYVADVETQCAAGERRDSARSLRESLRLPATALNSKKPLRTNLQLSLISLDLLLIGTAFLISSWMQFGLAANTKAIQFLVLLLPTFALVAACNRAYDVDCLLYRKSSAERALVAMAISVALLVGLLFYLKTSSLYSRGVVGRGVLFSALLLGIGRNAFASAIRKRRVRLTNDVLLIDGAPVRPEAGEIVIIADTATADGWNPQELHKMGTFLRHADRVVVAATGDRRARWVAALKGVGVEVEVLATELARLRPIGMRWYGPHPTLIVAAKPLAVTDSFKKRALDLALTIPTLLAAAPLFIVVAAAIKLDSRGPVFFRQPRLGEGNRIFHVLKFRTMRSDESDPAGKRLTIRGDARITRVGKVLRRTSVDELPQLFNVLKGHMSLVGPRPHALEAKAGSSLYWEVHPAYWRRAAVKPGLTGLAQVRGHRGPTETPQHLIDRVESDLEYLRGWTLWRDIEIIMQTIRVIVHANAY